MLEKKYDFKTVEEGKYDFWLKNNYFKSGDYRKEPFCIVIPPPNITGNLHLGHAWDTTLQDIIIRYKKMCGYDTLWLPGMDHAAIATENKVVSKLKERGITKSSISREEFLEHCWKWKEEHSDNIHNQWAKLGLALDYTKERFTLDEGLNNAVNTVFIDLYNRGLIYRGEKIINWDPIAKTALSNEEVIYKESKDKLYYLKYLYKNKPGYVCVATTRPETIFGDVAVAVNPKNEKYKEDVLETVIVPLVNREVPIIQDDAVLLDFGTGALKITPAHSQDDFEIGERHNLEIINTLNPDGTLNELTGVYNGLSVLDAREKIVEKLLELDLVEKIEDYTHTVGYSERTDAIVEPYLSKQWFVKMDSLAKNLLENQKTNDKIIFYPARFEKILNHWMENCHDWCISRQLYWGHRIPAWYKEDKVYIGINPPEESGWTQDEDVLDTWFSSALWPFSTLGWPEQTEDSKRYFPTNVLVTGYDIIFFWVARMAFESLEFTKKSPFKDCLIHGLIRDKQGRKMSKSLGNGIDPMDMIEKYGVDALRFYLTTSSSPGMDLRFDEEKLSSTWNFINKLWNASRYVLINLEDFNENDYTLENLQLSDEWILTELNETIKKVTISMNKYRFNDVGKQLYEFTWNIFCDWYIELSKSNLDSKTTKSVLLKVLSSILKMLHPFMPFVTEEIYKMLPICEESIMISDYPKFEKEYVFKTSKETIKEVIENITSIRNFKKDNGISKNAMIEIQTSDRIKPIFISLLKIDETLKVDKRFSSKLTYSSPIITIDFYFEKETNEESMIKKLLEEKEELIKIIEKRKLLLNNKNYIEKAPKEIVELDRTKLANEIEKLKLLEDKLKQIV